MKEMIYKPQREVELLAEGEHNGYEYYVLSLGTHPCCYIKLHDFDDAEKAEYNFNVHGGITYNEDHLIINDRRINGKIVGWDYAHLGDYCGLDEMFGYGHGSKYTTRELVGDCIGAIEDWIDLKGEAE